MNLFLYFKDREFFVKVVKNFLKNKKEKDPVDRFLLDDVEYFEKNLMQDGFALNSWRKLVFVLGFILLGKSLSTNRNTERDKAIINRFELFFNDVQAWLEQNQEQFKGDMFEGLFETVLDSKVAEKAANNAQKHEMIH